MKWHNKVIKMDQSIKKWIKMSNAALFTILTTFRTFNVAN